MLSIQAKCATEEELEDMSDGERRKTLDLQLDNQKQIRQSLMKLYKSGVSGQSQESVASRGSRGSDGSKGGKGGPRTSLLGLIPRPPSRKKKSALDIRLETVRGGGGYMQADLVSASLRLCAHGAMHTI